MRETEVAVLLALAHGHDQRHDTSDIKVRAWWSLFQQEAPTMEYEWAQHRINEHYARTTDMLMPAHLVTAWKQHRSIQWGKAAIPRGTGVPMPEWFKEQRREILGG